MEDKFLKEFLKTGLFDIGEADERLTWLKKAIADLEKKFEENYSLLPTYTLVALDPNVSDTEPVLLETEMIITTYWEALRVRFTDMPRNILRGVILNALNNVGTTYPIAARIVYLTASNIYPYVKLNKEKNLVEKMLTDLGEIAETNAIEEWSLIEEEPVLKLASLKIGSLKFEAVKLDETKFKEKFKEAFTNASTGHGPQHGLHEPNYQAHFISKATNAIATSFNSALEELNKSLSSTNIETPINKFFVEFKKSLDTNLKNSFTSLTVVERRSKLLWWKETLYSPSQKRSYRGLDKSLLPILMSSDLNDQVPEVTPISVDYLLRDTLFPLINRQDMAVKFSDYLTEVSKSNLKPILKSYFSNLIETKGRISITDFIALLLNDKINIKDFQARTGIEENEEITLVELSVIVLHDLLTKRLIAK